MLLQCVAVCCSVLQCVALLLQYVAVRCSALQCVAICCTHQDFSCPSGTTSVKAPSVLLQCVAACCSVLQGVVICCSVLHKPRFSLDWVQRRQSRLHHNAPHCNKLQQQPTAARGNCILKLQVSFAEYSLFYRALLQKRPRIAKRCSILPLRHISTHCTICQHAHLSTPHSTATHYNTLQHTATHCNTLHHATTQRNTMQHTATQ